MLTSPIFTGVIDPEVRSCTFPVVPRFIEVVITIIIGGVTIIIKAGQWANFDELYIPSSECMDASRAYVRYRNDNPGIDCSNDSECQRLRSNWLNECDFSGPQGF